MVHIQKYCLFFLLFLLTHTLTFAQGSRPFVGLSAGVSWLQLDGSTTILADPTVPPPFDVDRYSIHGKTAWNLGLFAGYQWQNLFACLPYTNLSLNYWHVFSNHVTGQVTQYGLPQFTNYHYKMHLQANILDALAKIDLWRFQQFMPYVAVGAGIVNTDIAHYHESPLAGVAPARVSPGFKANNNLQFGYTLGVGIDYILNDCYWLTIGYEYHYLNKLKTNHGRGIWANSKLDFGHLKTNGVFASITYFMNR